MRHNKGFLTEKSPY